MKTAIAALAFCFAAGSASAASCVGNNLIDALPQDLQAEIASRTEAVPYHEGLYWQAVKGNATISLIGTFHFDDAGHAAIVEGLEPAIADAALLLVEMGPEEEDRMKARMASDPSLMVDPDGPTLPERLSDEDWAALSSALEERGLPAIIASRLKPWYAATMLGLAPCMIREMSDPDANRGLDWRLMDVAEARGVPIRALEPWDTVLRMFAELTPEEEIEMIRYSLPGAAHADDYAVTMSDAYAEENVWQIWEFGRIDAYRNTGLSEAEVDEMTAEAQQMLMIDRNQSWIARLTEAASDAAGSGKGVVAAFGALHLPGEEGVLRLLEKDGWTIERRAL
ncbi:TraB/GumN family protein [Paracoccus sediminicola]|uniref:TraB/GumN family protein n=1 Tax=Paracoccus sediminicola TaxID=3017783 RepID=UPI0022F12BE2|nr:TraB/GumN family protein [Paracoccus sediminicola]WBU55760.1 TraB/GumN family protein [Paracoccus sediminicola]